MCCPEALWRSAAEIQGWHARNGGACLDLLGFGSCAPAPQPANPAASCCRPARGTQVSVHTEEWSAGALRGQVLPGDARPCTLVAAALGTQPARRLAACRPASGARPALLRRLRSTSVRARRGLACLPCMLPLRRDGRPASMLQLLSGRRTWLPPTTCHHSLTSRRAGLNARQPLPLHAPPGLQTPPECGPPPRPAVRALRASARAVPSTSSCLPLTHACAPAPACQAGGGRHSCLHHGRPGHLILVHTDCHRRAASQSSGLASLLADQGLV